MEWNVHVGQNCLKLGNLDLTLIYTHNQRIVLHKYGSEPSERLHNIMVHHNSIALEAD